MSSIKKRFIAGATCPKCRALDRLVVYRDGDQEFRECVACGFVEAMHFKPVPRELQTRVNTSAESIQAETQPVRVLDFGQPQDPEA